MNLESKDASSSKRILFGLYEVDLKAGELYRGGHRIALQSQPFQVLVMLLERAGSIVTKDELRHRIWGEDTIVDFDQSLRAAVTKAREVLGDSSDNPRFIETVPRRGYRFIAPVTVAEPTNPLAEQPSLSASEPESGQPPAILPSNLNLPTAEFIPSPSRVTRRTPSRMASKQRGWIIVLCACLLILIGSVLGYVGARRSKGVGIPALRQLTFDSRIVVPIPAKYAEQFPSMVTDGVHLFATAFRGGHTTLVQVSVNGGELQEVVMPDEIVAPTLGNISPDNSKLLLISHSLFQVETPLWVVPLGGRSARILSGVLGHDATWMPNGSDILYAANNELRILRPQNDNSEPFAKTPGRAFWLRWSPDGRRLRFTVIDPVTHSQSLWESASNDHNPRPLLNQWDERSNVCCGVWTQDGSSFIFQSVRDGESDLWRLSTSGGASPERLTNGPLNFEGPVVSRSGDRLFFTGVAAQSQIQTFDAATQVFKSANPFLRDAQEVAFSHDSLWVAWVDGTGRLWRARPDGKDQVQLSPETLHVYMVRWSPDNRHIAVMARQANQPWQLYLIRSDGSGLERLEQEPRNEADPTWSADGQALAFGRAPDYLAKDDSPWAIRILDLQTRQVRLIPGSEGLFSPRWSPDGKYIIAMSSDQKQLVLFSWQTHQWRVLAKGEFSNPSWSADSRSVYTQGLGDHPESILRISIPDGHSERLSTPYASWADASKDYSFIGLAPGDAPLVRIRLTGDVYSLDITALRQ